MYEREGFARSESLSHRELEILKLISAGLSNREIAASLYISVDTVKWYNKQIFSKLGVSSRTQAAAVARQQSQNQISAESPLEKVKPKHNLPLQLNSFLGRDKEIAELMHYISPDSNTESFSLKLVSRLVTLIGPGGVGKTRLAIQAVNHVLKRFPDGVWMIDFAPVLDPVFVPQTVAAVLGLREEGSQSIQEILISYLRSKTMLLLFDNCEHLIYGCAKLVIEILRTCPNVFILATSREGLGVAGEILILVEPLTVPDFNHSLPVRELIEYGGVRLFIDRAQTVYPSFSITAENSMAIARICQRLDGLPLAIELAAARVNVLSVEQISERLAGSFHLLSRGERTASSRSQTLRACMDWSFNLLSNAERILLQRMAVFIGGCTLEAIEIVCTDDQIQLKEVFNILAQLVEKSLVLVDRKSNGFRYRFLETIHQYATEKLFSSGERTTISNNHLNYFLRMIESLKLEQYGQDLLEGLNRIEADYDNLRAALDRSLTSRADRDISFRLLKQLGVYWELRGFLDEGYQRLSAALSLPEFSVSTLQRAELLFQCAWLAIYQSDIGRGLPLLEESRRIFEQHHPEGLNGVVDVLNSLAAIEIDSGDAKIALENAQKALEIASKINYPIGVNWAHHMAGVALGHLGEYDQAWTHLGAALFSFERARGMPSFISLLQSHGELAVWQGDYKRGDAYLDESLRLAREAKDKWMIGAILGTKGWIALRQGEHIKVKQLLKASIDVRRQIGDKGGIAWCLEKLAETAAQQEEQEKAVRILGKAEALRLAVYSPVNSADKPEFEQLLNTLFDRIEPQTFQSAWREGAIMPLDAVIDLALGI